MGYLDRSGRAMLRSRGSACYVAYLEMDHLQRKQKEYYSKGYFGYIYVGNINSLLCIGDAVVFGALIVHFIQLSYCRPNNMW